MGFLKNLKDFTIVKKSSYNEVQKNLDDMKTIADYTRPKDTSGLYPHLTLTEFSNMISPVDLYQISRYSDILRNVIPTIRNEIFRNGFLVKAEEIIVSSTQDDKIWSLIHRANHNEQTLKEVLMEFEDDLQIYDNGFLLALKEYFINEEKDIVGGRIDELIRVDPLICEKLLDDAARLGYDKNGNKVYFSINDRSQLTTEPRDKDGYQNLRACYKVKTGENDKDIAYYDSNEMLHVSKYNPSKTYGFSQLYSLYNKTMTLINQDTYIRNYYSGNKVPKGILTVNTANASSFLTMWNTFLQKVRNEPHGIHPLVNQSQDPSKNAFNFINFMNNLQEMQYTEVRNEMRQQIGALFNVSPIFQNDNSTSGGLNNEGLQITVTNRGVEYGQSIYNEKVLPFIFERNMGISDYTIKLKPSDEIDMSYEKDLRLKELQIAKATAELGIEVRMEKDGTFSYESGKVELQNSQEPMPFQMNDEPVKTIKAEEVKKAKIPLGDKEPPKGAKVIIGPRGGRYYELTSTETSEMTAKEKDIIDDYVNDLVFNTDLNYYLNNDELNSNNYSKKELEEKIKLLDSAIDKNIIPAEVDVYRGLKNFPDYEENDSFTHKGYMSTSSDKKIAEEFTQGVKKYPNPTILKLKLQQGKKGITTKHSGTDESEILLSRNKKFKVTNKTKENGINILQIEEETNLGKSLNKSNQLPKKEQKKFYTALEKELDEIIKTLDFTKKPTEAELNSIVEKVTKNLNKRLNAKSSNYIKVIYDKSKKQAEKEIGEKMDMTAQDRNIIEALKRDPLYRESFDNISKEMSDKLKETIRAAYEKPQEFTIDKIVDDMKENLDTATSSLRRIARTETSKVSIAARKTQYDKTGFTYKYKWIGPSDNRTGKDSQEIKKRTRSGVSWNELVKIIQDVSGPNWKVNPEAPIPRPNTRHTFIAERVEDDNNN